MNEEKINQILKNQMLMMKIMELSDKGVITKTERVEIMIAYAKTNNLLNSEQEESIVDKTKDAFCEKEEVEE